MRADALVKEARDNRDIEAGKQRERRKKKLRGVEIRNTGQETEGGGGEGNG